MKQLLLVFLGGGAGSVLRYAAQYVISSKAQSLFPWQTFLVNILGSLLIGYLLGWEGRLSQDLKFLLAVGFCGGFTTFSTFSAENMLLIQTNFWVGILYMSSSVILGFLACFGGMFLAKL